MSGPTWGALPIAVPIPAVALIHDLAILRAPGTQPWYYTWYRPSVYRRCRSADALLAPSSSTREDRVALLGVDPARVSVVPEAADERFRPASPVRARPDWLYVVGPVSDDELVALYSGAAVLAFPTLYEGFGLPVVEAMSCGAPVIASATSAIPELVGFLYLRVDVLMVGAMVGAGAVGLYFTAARCVEATFIVPAVLMLVFMPRLAGEQRKRIHLVRMAWLLGGLEPQTRRPLVRR